MIISPANTKPTVPTILESVEQLEPLLGGSGPTYVDFETTGLDMIEKDFRAVGVGIASSKCPQGAYAPINSDDDYRWLVTALYKQNLVGFNIGYDAKVLHRMSLDVGITPVSFPWMGDTLVLYKMLDNRGTTGQSWSLKTAQKEVLGWSETNEVDLDNWLIDNGYSRKSGGKLIAQKGEMWRAPVHILGHYCGLDAVSTMQLDEHLHAIGHKFPEMMSIYEREFMVLAKLTHEQFWHGLYVDKEKLDLYLVDLNGRIDALQEQFIKDSPASAHITEYNQAHIQKVLDAKPDQFTKTGKVAARYTKWQQKLEEVKGQNHFNLSSKQQLRWLFYERLYTLGTPRQKKNWKGDVITRFNPTTKKEWVIWEVDILDEGRVILTVEGKAYHGDVPAFSVDKEALRKLGEAGDVLFRYNALIKERGYVVAMLESLKDSVPPCLFEDARHCDWTL